MACCRPEPDDIVAGVVACFDNPPIDDGATKAGGSVSPHRGYHIGNSRSEDLGVRISVIEQACGCAKRRLLPMQLGDVRDTFADVGAIPHDLGFEPRTTTAEGVRGIVDGIEKL